MTIMQAININWLQANSIQELPEDWVLISINDEYRDLYPLQLKRDSDNILTMVFTDSISDFERDGKTYHTLNQEMATRVVDFVRKYKDKNFVIHCQAGVSRSSAVALYIHLKYGHTLKDKFWEYSNPNTQVLGMLLREEERKANLVVDIHPINGQTPT